MPILVHLTSHKNISRVTRSGILGHKTSICYELEEQQKYQLIAKAVYCLPVLQNHYLTHQWLRELKCSGQKNFVGVYFRLDSEELVWVGRYNQIHIQLTVDRAIALIMSRSDAQGYEIIIPRSIQSKEIHKIKYLPQVTGWRYSPAAHTNKPTCACPVCIPIGSIKSRKLRERIEPPEKTKNYSELIQELKSVTNSIVIPDILFQVHAIVQGGKKTKAEDLEFLLDCTDIEVLETLARILSAYRGKDAVDMLLELCTYTEDSVKEASATSLLKMLREEALVYLNQFQDDLVISKVVEAYKSDRTS
ncbi:MAG: hypothetical protein N4J56_000938 [Chroococcidiopsis sp. SAG 2025]|uniref:HEAT repeat domain-containing protein n=1 Tax=Chroococcidiopsis sp. SAG 2025 TaxID=171389 RepID=UPI002936D6D8|nr:HEAT repeat domain-containing protein [Chroococcidiopsis sp. SAG 2025]MDV2991284.1 hypothetical protein [Chroococcidiopsis sp. SAG 2025]